MTVEKILVLTKAYPTPSKKYIETVCTAGINIDTFELRRLYPINYRSLPSEKRYKKWQVIEVKTAPADRDKRKESRKVVNPDSIKILDEFSKKYDVDRYGKSAWVARLSIVKRVLYKSLEELNEHKKKDNISLGFIKPRRIIDFTINNIDDGEEWERKLARHTYTQQTTLMEHIYGIEKKPLEPIKYIFRYKFYCNDPRCSGHEIMVEDWELLESYRKWKDEYGDKEVIKKLKKKYFEWMTKERDLYFFMGTDYKYGKFLIIGLFYFPKKLAGQTTLS